MANISLKVDGTAAAVYLTIINDRYVVQAYPDAELSFSAAGITKTTDPDGGIFYAHPLFDYFLQSLGFTIPETTPPCFCIILSPDEVAAMVGNEYTLTITESGTIQTYIGSVVSVIPPPPENETPVDELTAHYSDTDIKTLYIGLGS
jgi:hypothetical protein